MDEVKTFTWHHWDFTFTRKEYLEGRYDARVDDFMESEDFDRLYFFSEGRFAGARTGNFFKRWKNIWGEGRGFEFRPLRRSDYGYFDDRTIITSWGNWALQTYGNFALGDSRKALAVLIGAMLFNDYALDHILEDLGGGASFVYNMQMGYNLYHYMFFKNPSWTTTICSAVGVFGVTIGAPLQEFIKGDAFGEKTSHKAHAIGVGMGLLSGLLLNAI